MNKIRKMPIFYPVLGLINLLFAVFIYFPQWLIGYWWCPDCGEKYGIDAGKISTQAADICVKCYKDKY